MRKILISIMLFIFSVPAFAVIITNMDQRFILSGGQSVFITETLEKGQTVSDFIPFRCTIEKTHEAANLPPSTLELKADGQVRYLYKSDDELVDVSKNLLHNLIFRKSFSFGVKSNAEPNNNVGLLVICKIEPYYINNVNSDKIITPF